MTVYWVLLSVIACERVAELVVSARHAAGLLRRGGTEYGFGHFPVMIALHVGLIAGCVFEPLLGNRAFIPALGWPMLIVTVLANGLRWWCIATLGPRWTARVIVLPGEPLVRSGPYRWFAHPNYAAVIIEGFALPLTGSAWITAVSFTVLNAWLLTVRIRCETRALASASEGARGGGTSGLGTSSDPGTSSGPAENSGLGENAGPGEATAAGHTPSSGTAADTAASSETGA